MKKILIILNLFSMISCNLSPLLKEQENEYYPLPEAYKSNLEQNAVLIYNSNHDKTDTLYCVLRIDGTMRVALTGEDGKDPSIKWEFQTFYFCDTNDSLYLSQEIPDYLTTFINYPASLFGDGCMNGDIPKSDKLIRLSIGYDDQPRDFERDFTPKVDWYDVKSSQLKWIKLFDSLEINNKTYTGVNEYAPLDTSESNLNLIYVNKGCGILKYEYDNGIIWSLK